MLAYRTTGDTHSNLATSAGEHEHRLEQVNIEVDHNNQIGTSHQAHSAAFSSQRPRESHMLLQEDNYAVGAGSGNKQHSQGTGLKKRQLNSRNSTEFQSQDVGEIHR